MNISPAFSRLLQGESLSRYESLRLFDRIFKGKVPETQVKSLLVLLAEKGETADEVLGCLEALRQHEPAARGSAGLLDTCGTGGDKSYSLNVSTLAALTAAGAGCRIAKHGNRAFSSRCGSSDLLEAFGVNLNSPRAAMARSIKKHGIGYFHAPSHHPVIGRFQALRKNLRIKTIFNLLGPLSNPMKIETQMVGVANAAAFNLYVSILKKSGIKRALVVYGDGLDEISCCAPTLAALIEKGKARIFEIDYKKAGLRTVSPAAMRSRSLKESKSRSEKILNGQEKGPALDLILLNAGAAIWTAGKAHTLGEGIENARVSLKSGKALAALKALAAESWK